MGIEFTISNDSNCSLLQLNEPMRIKAPKLAQMTYDRY